MLALQRKKSDSIQQSDIEALKLSCGFSFITNRLGYCGKENAHSEFGEFLRKPNEENAGKVKRLLESFIGLHSYLAFIAEQNDKQPFDREVIEAYWLGNELLEDIDGESFKEFVNKTLVEKGLLPERIARKKTENLPEKIYPHHSFHVLYMNFFTKNVDAIPENLDKCIVKWGKVVDVKENEVIVRSFNVAFDGRFFTHQAELKTENILFPELKRNDNVAVHWNFISKKLEDEEIANLKKYTFDNIELANLALNR